MQIFKQNVFVVFVFFFLFVSFFLFFCANILSLKLSEGIKRNQTSIHTQLNYNRNQTTTTTTTEKKRATLVFFFLFKRQRQLNEETLLQALWACAFRPDITGKYLYMERWGRALVFLSFAHLVQLPVPLLLPFHHKCRLFHSLGFVFSPFFFPPPLPLYIFKTGALSVSPSLCSTPLCSQGH